MACIACGRFLHWECLQQPCCCGEKTQALTEAELIRRGRERQESVGVSAGRKRAAADYQIDPSLPCEWREKKNCGGGLKPIVGCLAGFQTHRHHGPVKDTTRNERENIHLICVGCHNGWHAKNDPLYDEEIFDRLPHSPVDLDITDPDDLMILTLGN